MAPRWLNRRWPCRPVASTLLELISRSPMSHVPRDRVPLTGLHVHQPVPLEPDLEGLATALAEESAEGHTGLEGLPDVSLVGDVGPRVDDQRILRADPQYDGRSVGHDGRLPVPLDGRGEQPVALRGAAQSGEGRARPEPGIRREQIA